MADAAKVKFALHEGVNRVEIAVAGSDETVVLTSDRSEPFATDDPELVRTLSEHPMVKRAETKSAGSKASK